MRTNKILASKLLLVLTTLCFSANNYALPEDKNKPIDVAANSASMDNKNGTTVLTGKVEIIQGTMLINANKVVVQRDKNGDISTMVATGNLAHFTQQQQAGSAYSKAWGKKMVYSVANQTVTITGNAKVTQLNDTFTGEIVTYHMDKAIVKASGTKQRVKMIIQPKGQK